MSEYKMNISGKIGLADYSSIDDYMAIVNTEDNLIITIDDNVDDNVNLICHMLKNNNFLIDLNETSYDGKHFIKAFKDID